MGTVYKYVDKCRGKFGDSTYPLFWPGCLVVIQGLNPQHFFRAFSGLNEKVGNLQTYDYY